VDEHREGQPELVAVERSRGLADDNGLEAAVGPCEVGEQTS
jgi:hypothetical protein